MPVERKGEITWHPDWVLDSSFQSSLIKTNSFLLMSQDLSTPQISHPIYWGNRAFFMSHLGLPWAQSHHRQSTTFNAQFLR